MRKCASCKGRIFHHNRCGIWAGASWHSFQLTENGFLWETDATSEYPEVIMGKDKGGNGKDSELEKAEKEVADKIIKDLKKGKGDDKD